jgi:hypothetical protein
VQAEAEERAVAAAQEAGEAGAHGVEEGCVQMTVKCNCMGHSCQNHHRRQTLAELEAPEEASVVGLLAYQR